MKLHDLADEAERVFRDEVNITTEGKKHLGAAPRLPLNTYIINWWLSFLRDRKQRIVHRNVTCNWKTVNKETTQGSVSGPYCLSFLLMTLMLR